jgi:hypothetical protein
MPRAADNKFLTESGPGTGMGELLRRLWIPVLLSKELPEQGKPPPQAARQDRYAVRSGACVTSRTKDLPAVMLERFSDVAGFVGRPRIAAAE